MPLSLNPAHLAAALIHRLMLATVALGAARIWVSIPAWKDAIRPYAFRRAPIRWLPVPSPFIAPPSEPSAARIRISGSGHPVVGHFGTYAPLIVALLEPALAQVLRETSAVVVLLGNGSLRFREQLLSRMPDAADRVSASGILEPAALSAQLQACDVMLQPYSDGISARRTTAVALLAHGVPFVSNEGRLTEPFWRESGAVELAGAPDAGALGARTIALLSDDAACARLARAGKDLHDRLFDVRHVIGRLTDFDASGSGLQASAGTLRPHDPLEPGAWSPGPDRSPSRAALP
jgi:glycosyltransferase involved in cell wall biosynthesis